MNTDSTHQLNLSEPQLAVDLLPDALLLLSEEGRIYSVNKACEELFETPAEQLKGRAFAACVHPEDMEAAVAFVKGLMKKQSGENVIFRIVKTCGEVRYLSWRACWSEKEQATVLSGRDVTELMEHQNRHLAKEDLFQALIENSFDMLALTDKDGNYLYISETMNNHFGYTSKVLLGTNCFTYIHPEDLPRILLHNSNVQEKGKKINVPPYRFRNAAGEWLWLEAVVTNQLDHPTIKGIVISARDITQQYHAEIRLKQMQLLEAVVEGEEKERSRIARDLHDEVSGMIAAAKMHFASLVEEMAELNAKTAYQQGMNLLEVLAFQVRRTSHNLMPDILQKNGLSAALQWYCKSVSSDQLRISFFAMGENRRYAANFELLLYRIAQELISNIIRHAGASEAIVQISRHRNLLSLSIEDNGKGFHDKTNTKGTGLQSIRKRVHAMAGSMEVTSETGNGTQIYMEFEINPQLEREE